MAMDITFQIDEDLNNKFVTILQFTQDNPNVLIHDFLTKYVANKARSIFGTNDTTCDDEDDTVGESVLAKAVRRIPKWAKKKDQANHRIIRAYMTAEADVGTGNVTVDLMKRICSDQYAHPECFVPNFMANYNQMKTDAGNSNGKVFESDGHRVWIWDEVKDTVMANKKDFYPGE